MTVTWVLRSVCGMVPQAYQRALLSLWSCIVTSLLGPSLLTVTLQTEPRRPDQFGGVFTIPHDPNKKPDKEQEKKVKAVLERLRHYGIDNIVESNVEYALQHSPQGDPEAAFRLLMLLEDTYEGIVKPYVPEIKMIGAVNREGVTCYLDGLLFAMFARLDSFEAMLYQNFEDLKRKRLAGLIRLWVNMLRTGRLITTDITEHLQAALAECGWSDAGRLRQQDPSEAFTFVTGQLELPMLTLKMDMYHTGKEDPQDDHKFVNERLLEVAILDEPPEGSSVTTLEDCLEHYFNNRIEVKRHMENQRRNTLKSAQPVGLADLSIKTEKEPAAHVEVVEVTDTPIAMPSTETPWPQSRGALENLRPTIGRKRADSIFSSRKVELDGIDLTRTKSDDQSGVPELKARKLSTRTEVLMPAWQFFKLLPWYTDHMPTSDAQVAAHFSKKRPVLGICLKRYLYTNTGQARRLDTYVDIPLEIAVPNFVGDDSMHEEGPLVGNFRLLLQSVVCHRGVSVHSGHYVCLCRGRAGNAPYQNLAPSSDRSSSVDSEGDIEDPWMRFDDLSKERVSYVDIHQALKDEMPYLLFYQVQPIGDDGHSIHDLPSYTEATSRSQSDATTLEKPYPQESEGSKSDAGLAKTVSEPVTGANGRPSAEVTNWGTSVSERTSLDVNIALDQPARGRTVAASDGEARRKSIQFDASSFSGGTIKTDPASSSGPTTPSEEKGNGLLSVAGKIGGSRRGSRASKSTSTGSRSRPTSIGPDNSNRFSLNMSKLAQMVSNKSDAAPGAPDVQPSEHAAAELPGQKDVQPAAAAVNDPPAMPLSATGNESKESVGGTSKGTQKVRKDKAAVRAHEKLEKRKGHHHHKAEDRDCVLM